MIASFPNFGFDFIFTLVMQCYSAWVLVMIVVLQAPEEFSIGLTSVADTSGITLQLAGVSAIFVRGYICEHDINKPSPSFLFFIVTK